jgi:biopolymer transport protein ExbB
MSLMQRTVLISRAAAVIAALLLAAGIAGAALAQTAPQAAPSAATPVAPAAPDAPPAGAAVVPPAIAPAGEPAAAPATATQEIVENPYGLSALWANGDWIARGTLIALVVMSMGSWYIMITKVIEQAVLLRQASEANRNFWNAASLRDGADALGRRSAFRGLVEDGLRASEHHEGTLTAQIDLHSWITMSLQRSVDAIGNRLQGGLAFLATVGSTAPFVGLFGTVWGIYHALTAIGIAGQASIDKVAGPVGEALIMTAIGLAVAVPAVLGYNWMVRRNKHAMDRVRSFAADLHALLIGGTRAQPRPVAARSVGA